MEAAIRKMVLQVEVVFYNRNSFLRTKERNGGAIMPRQKMKDLTESELEIMKTVWDSPESLTIQEMAERMQENGIAITSAAAITRVKGLQKKKYLQPDGQKLVTTVYARTYQAMVTKEEYVQRELADLGQLLSGNQALGALGLVEMLIKGRGKKAWNRQDIQSLEQLLEHSGDELKEGEK